MYYVYTLAYPNGRVFYVGKGSNGRIHDHEQEAKNGGTSHKCNVIRKIWRGGEEVRKEKVAFFENESDAYAHEVALMNSIGMENLTNLQEGGKGGWSPSAEVRAKQSAARLGRTVPRYVVEKQRLSNTGKKHSAATIAKLRLIKQGTAPSESALARAVEATSKLYPGFVSPDGVEYRNVKNLSAFCRKHELSIPSMNKVALGRQKAYRGWRSIAQ